VRRSAAHLAAPALAAVIAMTAALVAAGGAPGATPAGLPDAGAVIRWGVPTGRLLLDLCAIVTVGALLVATVLVPPEPGGGPVRGPAAAAMRSASAWSAAWAVTSLGLAALTVSDVTGIPLHRLPAGQLLPAAWSLPPTRALLLVAILATVVLGCSCAARRRRGAVIALVVAVLALTPPLYAGHAVHAGEHQVATGSLVVHVVAATVWLGGLVGLALHIRAGDPALPTAVSRFSTLALGCFCALTATGLLAAVAGLGTSRASWASPYAAVLAVKVAAALGLGLIGWSHRRWTLARLRAGRPRAFARLAAVELAIMGATVGIAVALSRTPGATSNGLLGRATRSVGPGAAPEPVSVGDLLSDWRPEPVLSTLAVIALVTYLHGVRQAAARGHSWPARRTVFAVGATVLALLALGIPTSYDSQPLLTVQTAQHLVLALMVPALLALSGAGALARPVRASALVNSQEDRWRQRLNDPTTGFVALVVATVLVLRTPLQTFSTTSAPGHLLGLAVSLAAGSVFCWSVLGLDPAAACRSPRDRAPVLGAAALFLIGFGIVLAARSAGLVPLTPPGSTGASLLGLTDDQHRAAQVVWLFAITLGPLAALALRGQYRTERDELRGLTPRPPSPSVWFSTGRSRPIEGVDLSPFSP